MVEAPLGEELVLPLAVLNKDRHLFDDCQHMDIQWALKDRKIFELDPKLIPVGSANNANRSDGYLWGAFFEK